VILRCFELWARRLIEPKSVFGQLKYNRGVLGVLGVPSVQAVPKVRGFGGSGVPGLLGVLRALRGYYGGFRIHRFRGCQNVSRWIAWRLLARLFLKQAAMGQNRKIAIQE